MNMKKSIFAGLVLLLCLGGFRAATRGSEADHPQFSGDKLTRPENYREWVFLSSGLGMSYTPMAGMPQQFTNVFVPQWAYHEFLNSGKWPEQTMFVVEERNSETKGSINKEGHFQAQLEGVGVEVKDTKRFPEKWAYFNFDATSRTATANPKAACWQCHEDNAAVEHSFVQFYPTLIPVAKKFNTYHNRQE